MAQRKQYADAGMRIHKPWPGEAGILVCHKCKDKLQPAFELTILMDSGECHFCGEEGLFDFYKSKSCLQLELF